MDPLFLIISKQETVWTHDPEEAQKCAFQNGGVILEVNINLN